MKRWLREFLGIPELFEGRLRRLERESEGHTRTLGDINRQLAVITPHLARIVGVIDPLYATDEQNPERKAASDALGEAVLNKMLAEHTERSKYNPTGYICPQCGLSYCSCGGPS